MPKSIHKKIIQPKNGPFPTNIAGSAAIPSSDDATPLSSRGAPSAVTLPLVADDSTTTSTSGSGSTSGSSGSRLCRWRMILLGCTFLAVAVVCVHGLMNPSYYFTLQTTINMISVVPETKNKNITTVTDNLQKDQSQNIDKNRKNNMAEEEEKTKRDLSFDGMTVDQILSDELYYQTEEIRGTNDTLLGHYWFPTQQLEHLGNHHAETETETEKQQPKLWPLNRHQKDLLNDIKHEVDGRIDHNKEKARCDRYSFPYDSSRTQRRRIFYGASIADDSFFILQTVATESYDIFHTVSFVESNMTHTRTPRELRFPPNSYNLRLLTQSPALWGNNTKVSVEYFAPPSREEFVHDDGSGSFDWQFLQREGILRRWKLNGMRPDDVGIMADTDEFFSRDFLRALQICDVPEFRPNQDCRAPKLLGSTLMYEGSPECIVSNRKLWHPNAMIGECIEGIGDSKLHPPANRIFYGMGKRQLGYGRDRRDFDLFLKDHYNSGATIETPGVMYPLHSAADLRFMESGRIVRANVPGDEGHSAFHVHNTFESSQQIRHKYTTYGEPIKRSKTVPLGAIHDVLNLVGACAHGWQNFGPIKYHLGGHAEKYPHPEIPPSPPVFFENEELRRTQHETMKQVIFEDEAIYGAANATWT